MFLHSMQIINIRKISIAFSVLDRFCLIIIRMAQTLLNEWNHIVYFSDLIPKPNHISSLSLLIVRIWWENPCITRWKSFMTPWSSNSRQTFIWWIHVNYAFYILIGIKLIIVLFYSEPNILPRKLYTQSSFRNNNEYHYINYSSASHLHK
jgi:hypothetical protein